MFKTIDPLPKKKELGQGTVEGILSGVLTRGGLTEQHWNVLPGGSILAAQSREFDRNNELVTIDRDRTVRPVRPNSNLQSITRIPWSLEKLNLTFACAV
jgi:hypothetical protein